MFVITGLTNLMSLESLQSTVLGMLSCVALLIALAQGTPLGRFRPWDRFRTQYFLLPAFVIFVGTERLGGWQLSARESFFIPLVFGFVAALVCWFGHRLAACIVLILPLRAKMLLDWRWAEKIICYESVFLWVYCVVWGVMISSFIIFGGWMSNSRAFDGLRRATGLLAEPSAVLGMTILLSILWAWRYAVALRAARWNNF
jgi:hypothetical protein